MPRPSPSLAGLCLTVACSFACDSKTPADTGMRTPDGGADALVRSWPGSVYEDVRGPDGGTIPIANAKVCVVEHPEVPCATTDGEGNYTMAVPLFGTSLPFAVAFTAPGHLGKVSPGDDDSWPTGIGLASDANAAAMASQAGFQYPARGTAFVELYLLAGGEQGFAGATVTMSPASGTGPVYLDPQFRPDPSLRATSSSGKVLFGNVTPGRVTLTAQASGKTCATWDVEGPWPDSGPNVVSVPAQADAITTQVLLWCR